MQAFTDEVGVTGRYAVMARDNHSFAKLNKIGLDQDGNPDPADLHLAWAAGARAFQLAPRDAVPSLAARRGSGDWDETDSAGTALTTNADPCYWITTGRPR